MKVYIVKNYLTGWKVVKEDRCVDCTKPLYDSKDVSNRGLELCRKYCQGNKLVVIRECR